MAQSGRTDRGEARRGRLVTYGLVLVLLGGVVFTVEAWPVTSYRLFSAVRTGRSSALELVAVAPDGARRVVRPGGGEVGSTTRHRYRDLVGSSPDERRRLVLAWLELAGVDPSEVRVVRLEAVARRLDPDGGPSTELDRRLLVEVPL